MIRTIRMVALAVAALGAALPTTSQAYPCPASPYTASVSTITVFSDCGYHTGVLTGDLGATAAQVVCVTPTNCTRIERSGVYYDWDTNKVCYAYAGRGWYSATGGSC